MVANSFNFDLNGVEGYTAKLRRIRDRANNRGSMFRSLAARFKDSEKKIFNTGGRALGRQWAPLSPDYREWKRRHYPGQPILQRTGRLKDSLTKTPEIRFRGNTMEIGTNVKYSKWLQDGVAEHNLPPRPHVGLTFGDRVAWVRDVQQYIATGRPMKEY